MLLVRFCCWLLFAIIIILVNEWKNSDSLRYIWAKDRTHIHLFVHFSRHHTRMNTNFMIFCAILTFETKIAKHICNIKFHCDFLPLFEWLFFLSVSRKQNDANIVSELTYKHIFSLTIWLRPIHWFVCKCMLRLAEEAFVQLVRW